MRIARIIIWAACVALCALAFVRTGWVVLLAAVVAAVLVPLGGFAAALLAARSASVSLEGGETVAKGAPVGLRVVLENRSAFPVAHATVRVRARNLLTGEDEVDVVPLAIGPHAAAEMPLAATSGSCGRLMATVADVRFFDPFRIFSRRVPLSAEAQFTVVPDLHEMLVGTAYASAPLSDTTVFSPFVRGADLSEVFGLREYEPGDELRRVHWKLSEKGEALIVRDASLPLDNSILVFWDKSAGVDGSRVERQADALAETMLAVMVALVRAGVSFETATNDVETGRCPRFFISGEDDLYEALGHMLSSPLGDAGACGLEVYANLHGSLACSRLVYVAGALPAGFGSLAGTCETLAFLCRDRGAGSADGGAAGAIPAGGGSLSVRREGGNAEVSYTPDETADALALAGVM